MARIKIILPAKQLAQITIPVRITDINYGQHLGNDALVGILQEARLQWLTGIHYSELDIGGAGLIMSDLAVEYIKESFYGDQLSVMIFIGDISSVSFELFYEIINQDAKIIAKAKTGMVCFDYQKRKVTNIPGEFRALL